MRLTASACHLSARGHEKTAAVCSLLYVCDRTVPTKNPRPRLVQVSGVGPGCVLKQVPYVLTYLGMYICYKTPPFPQCSHRVPTVPHPTTPGISVLGDADVLRGVVVIVVSVVDVEFFYQVSARPERELTSYTEQETRRCLGRRRKTSDNTIELGIVIKSIGSRNVLPCLSPIRYTHRYFIYHPT